MAWSVGVIGGSTAKDWMWESTFPLAKSTSLAPLGMAEGGNYFASCGSVPGKRAANRSALLLQGGKGGGLVARIGPSRGAPQRAKLTSCGRRKGSSVYLTEDGIERTDDSHDVGDKMTANHSVEGLKIHEGRGPNPDAVGLRRAIADDVVAKDAFR